MPMFRENVSRETLLALVFNIINLIVNPLNGLIEPTTYEPF
jgi:hypothetical protein